MSSISDARAIAELIADNHGRLELIRDASNEKRVRAIVQALRHMRFTLAEAQIPPETIEQISVEYFAFLLNRSNAN